MFFSTTNVVEISELYPIDESFFLCFNGIKHRDYVKLISNHEGSAEKNIFHLSLYRYLTSWLAFLQSLTGERNDYYKSSK